MNDRLLSRMTSSAGREKLLFLIRQLAITGLNALTGFIILRGLTKTDYSVYTVIFSLLAIFTNITNVGITPAMSGIGGRIWNKPTELQALLNAALQLRYRISSLVVLPFVGFCIWQFWGTGLSWIVIGLLCLILLAAAWVQVQAALYAIVLQLNKAVQNLQRNELWVVLVKVSGIFLLALARAPVVAVVGWICFCLLLNLKANQRLAGAFLIPHRQTSPEYLENINRIVRSNLLRTVYWSLEAQISVLLCALFASTDAVAEIGALGRLGVYFAIFQAFILNYSLPQLARHQDKAGIRTQLLHILGLTIVLILPILLWAIVHPQSLLWLLGPNYNTLGPWLFPFLSALAIGQLAATVYQMCAAKAWIDLNRYYVPLALPLQITLIISLDLSQLSHVILLVGITNLFFLGYNLFMLYYSFTRFIPNTDSN